MTPRWSGDGAASDLTRRAFLGGLASATLLAAGCSDPRRPELPGPQTVTSLMAETPFYIAHRGGGSNWPEMTGHAYDQAAALPWIKALEISVRRTADGVLVCSHDSSTARLTGISYTIEQQPWSVLAQLLVKPTYTLDPRQPARPYARLEEVLEKHLGRLVVFVEPKDESAVEPLLATMTRFDAPERVVWKQPVNQPHFAEAKDAGFTTWGYVLNEKSHRENLGRFIASPTIDTLGAPRYEGDDFTLAIARPAEAVGKKTIMWPIRTPEDRARALGLGCSGMMTSNVVDVPPAPL